MLLTAGVLMSRGLLVLMFLLALRLWRINWQLPEALYYDALKYVQWASRTAASRQPTSTDFRNPSLLRHLLTIEDRLANGLSGRQSTSHGSQLGAFGGGYSGS
jgi:hypothetical protein